MPQPTNIQRHRAAYNAVFLGAMKTLDALHQMLIQIIEEEKHLELSAAAALYLAELANGRVAAMRVVTHGKALEAIEERALRADDEVSFEAFAHALQELREAAANSEELIDPTPAN